MKKLLLAALLLASSAGWAQGYRPYLPKSNQNLPDSYGVKIYYVTGKVESFELASHTFTKETGLFEFTTKDDLWNWVPISSVQRIEFDKRFSEIMATKEKEMEKKETELKKTGGKPQ